MKQKVKNLTEQLAGRWRALSFGRKLKYSFYVAVFIPAIFLCVYYYVSSAQMIREQRQRDLSNLMRQSLTALQGHITNCENSTLYLAGNYGLQNYVLNQNMTLTERAESTRKHISPLFYNVLLANPYLKRVHFYADRSDPFLQGLIIEKTAINDRLWYRSLEEDGGTSWYLENERLNIARLSIGGYPERIVGVVTFEISDDLFRDSFRTFSQIPCKLSLKNVDDLIYEQNYDSVKQLGTRIVEEIPALHLTLTCEVDQSYFSPVLSERLIWTTVIFALCFLFVGKLIHIISRSLLKRIFDLVHTMEMVGHGQFNLRLKNEEDDEIGVLIDSFHRMLEEIQKLINENYRQEIRQKEQEIRLLRARINPHFLYNTLSTVNWLALGSGQEKISRIVTALSKYYRSSLNKGADFCTAAYELSNVEAYLSIQSIAYEDIFNYRFYKDETLLELSVPNFILQPLVENAIEHGIMLNEKGGQITISLKEMNGKLVFEVMDNGNELYQRQGEAELPESEYGYGLGNVRDRIKLLGGADSSLRIKSLREGTVSEVILPLKRPDKIG